MAYFQTKNPHLGTFCWALYVMEDVILFYGRLVYFESIWDILLFGTSLARFWCVCTKKNLATLSLVSHLCQFQQLVWADSINGVCDCLTCM
jgi:hypothetical protein